MKRLLIPAIALVGLSGCATYDYAGGSAPGGYYSGSPRYEYSYPDGYYGAYGGSYGYGFWGDYGGYGYSPWYYGGYSRPIYVIRPAPRPPRGAGDHNGHRPPPGGLRPDLPGRPRPPAGRPMPPRAEGGVPPSRPMPARPPGQPQSQPRPQSRPASPAVQRGSHFRNRPSRDDR